ncbi:MAG: SprB repeat-containing protein [Proteobacteria bacterium]|nr:SprB repeat-containing protein [Pseudomonadota bacterium]
MTRINDSCGAAEGSINLTVSGGTAPLTYAWSNGANTEDITGLAAGTYTCTITDANGCTIESTTTLVDQAITVTDVITINDICGANTGSIDLTVTGDGGPFIYAWSNGVNTEDITGLEAGTYTCTITDINGCIVESTSEITGMHILIIEEVNIVNDNCEEGSGAIDITVSGGAAPYTYLWSPSGGSDAVAINLTAGTNTVTVTDSNSCTYQDSVTIGNITGIDQLLTTVGRAF